MIVSKCDACGTEYREGEFPDWMQLTGERGVIISNAHKAVTKFAVLDFCCPACMEKFFTDLATSMKPVEQEV